MGFLALHSPAPPSNKSGSWIPPKRRRRSGKTKTQTHLILRVLPTETPPAEGPALLSCRPPLGLPHAPRLRCGPSAVPSGCPWAVQGSGYTPHPPLQTLTATFQALSGLPEEAYRPLFWSLLGPSSGCLGLREDLPTELLQHDGTGTTVSGVQDSP